MLIMQASMCKCVGIECSDRALQSYRDFVGRCYSDPRRGSVTHTSIITRHEERPDFNTPISRVNRANSAFGVLE
jgi:hypothetical protein